MINIEDYFEKYFKGSKLPTTESMKYFINKYTSIDKELKFIHIAGTNGKGSCTQIISNILQSQGYKVGKFLSPHLISYNERISINGKMISDEEMSDLINELEPTIKAYNVSHEQPVSLFELITMIALLYFYKNHVDFAVLETGLGGLFDSTNIISKPLVSVITSIGFDHMHILGNTLPEIAHEKAGIIKENSNTVIFSQEPEVNQVFIDTCKQKNNKLHIISERDISNYHFDDENQYFNFKNLNNIDVNLKGKIQIKNACLCIECINILNSLGYTVTEENLRKGLSTVVNEGRMETLSKKPLIIYDGAHNPPAIKVLQDIVISYYKNYRRTYIISILKTKDYEKMLKMLSEDKDAKFILTSGNDKDRYVSCNDLYNVLFKYTNPENIDKMELDDAVEFVYKNNNNDCDVSLIIGSFYVYGNVVNKIKQFNK